MNVRPGKPHEGGVPDRFCRRAFTISGMPTAAAMTARPIRTYAQEGSPDAEPGAEAGGVADGELDGVDRAVADVGEVLGG